MELEFDTKDKMSFGREIIHVEGDRNLVVNKMTRVFNKGVMWSRNRDGSVSLAAGDIFASKQDMLQVVKDLCVQEGFHLQKIKNEKTRYTQKCAYPGCNWRIHCSVLVDRMTWMVKTITGRYSCPRPEQNRMATSKWVVNHLLSVFKTSPKMKVAWM